MNGRRAKRRRRLEEQEEALAREHGLISEDELAAKCGVPVSEVRRIAAAEGLGVRQVREGSRVRWQRQRPQFSDRERNKAEALLREVVDREEGDDGSDYEMVPMRGGFVAVDSLCERGRPPSLLLTVCDLDDEGVAAVLLGQGEVVQLAEALRVAICLADMLDAAMWGTTQPDPPRDEVDEAEEVPG